MLVSQFIRNKELITCCFRAKSPRISLPLMFRRTSLQGCWGIRNRPIGKAVLNFLTSSRLHEVWCIYSDNKMLETDFSIQINNLSSKIFIPPNAYLTICLFSKKFWSTPKMFLLNWRIPWIMNPLKKPGFTSWIALRLVSFLEHTPSLKQP